MGYGCDFSLCLDLKWRKCSVKRYSWLHHPSLHIWLFSSNLEKKEKKNRTKKEYAKLQGIWVNLCRTHCLAGRCLQPICTALAAESSWSWLPMSPGWGGTFSFTACPCAHKPSRHHLMIPKNLKQTAKVLAVQHNSPWTGDYLCSQNVLFEGKGGNMPVAA